MVKVVSGTAAALGHLNQLSNPMQYDKYRALTNMLMPKLEPIDTLFFVDQVKNKLNGFFAKIENPLNIVAGIGDIFTGGSISKIIDNFKALITKGYSTERLLTLGFRKGEKLVEEQHRGVRLYLEAEEFFRVIELENEKNMVLNKKIYDIYQHSQKLNTDILNLYIEYLQYAKIPADKNAVDQLVKNQAYTQYQAPAEQYFTHLLGERQSFDKNEIANRLKDMDLLLQRINTTISEYDKLANQLSSFYADFRTTMERDCPFRNVSANDRQRWEREVNNILNTMNEVEQTFNAAYTKVDFNKE